MDFDTDLTVLVPYKNQQDSDTGDYFETRSITNSKYFCTSAEDDLDEDY